MQFGKLRRGTTYETGKKMSDDLTAHNFLK